MTLVCRPTNPGYDLPEFLCSVKLETTLMILCGSVATAMEISELKSAVEAISRTQNEMVSHCGCCDAARSCVLRWHWRETGWAMQVAQGFVMEDKLAKQAELLATTNSKLDLVLKALKVELPD